MRGQEYLPIGQSLRRNCCRTAQMHRPCPARALDGATTPSSPLPCQRQAHLGPKASPRHALQETWRRHAGNGTLPSRHRQRGCAGSDQARRLLLAQLGMKRLYRYVLKEQAKSCRRFNLHDLSSFEEFLPNHLSTYAQEQRQQVTKEGKIENTGSNHVN